MTLTLRPYQQQMISDARMALRTHDNVLLVAPTGSGKTALATTMLRAVADKKRVGFFICHRIEILEQTLATFKKFNLQCGVIASGMNGNPYMPIQVCSIDTLRARIRSGYPLPSPDLCIYDEAHHTVSASWAATKTHFSGAKNIGLTATPERLDGRGLGEQFTSMITGPSVVDLIGQKYLSPYKFFAPTAPDMEGVRTRMGEFVQSEIEAVMDKPTITGDAIAHYLKIARGKKFICRCVSVKHSQHVAEQFRAAGVMAWHIDGNTSRGERAAAMAAFRRGEITGLTYVDLVSEGLDVPDAVVFIDMRPTKSRALCLQGWGRVMRYLIGKIAYIFDHANNFKLHGLPDDERQWTLEGRERRKGESEPDIGIKQCPLCYAVHRPAPKCPECGFVYEINARVVEQVDGELSEVDIAAARHEKREAQWKAQTLEELIAVGYARKHRSPEKWASFVWTSRMAKRGAVG